MSQVRKNTIIYTVGNVLPTLGNFLLLPVLTRYLSPSEYGTVNAMLIVSSIAAILFTLAMDRSVWRLHHDYDEAERRDLLGTLMIAVSVTATLGLGLAFLGRGVLQLAFPTVPFYPFYVYALLAAYVGAFGSIPRIQLQVTGQAMRLVALSLGQFLLTSGLVLWFVIAGQGPAGMLKGQLIGALVFSAVFFVLGAKMARFVVRKDMLRNSTAFSLPLIPNLLFAWVLHLSDRVFLGRFRSLAEVGVYSAGYRIGNGSNLLTGSFFQAYNPVFYALANSEDQESARDSIGRYNTTFLVVTIAIGFAVAFLAPEAVDLLLPPAYAGAAGIVQVIALAYTISQAQGLLELQIYQSKRTAGLTRVYALGAATNIGLNLLLVPRYGFRAAAWTTAVAFAVMFAADYAYARRGYFIPFRWREVLPWGGAALAMVLVGRAVPASVASLAVKTVVTTALFLAIERRYGVLGLRRLTRRFARDGEPADGGLDV